MSSAIALLSLAAFLSGVRAQQVGTQLAETHPSLSWQKCTASGCTTQAGKITLDANWRWLHTTSGYTNCYTGNKWDATLCPDATTCATNCALDGADYSGTYGITTSGNALTLKFVTNGSQKNVGSRVYLMASDTAYQEFKMLNQEFTFDVDVSKLPCGLNGAVYFSSMEADGGMAKNSANKAGAKYGTGYCDSQCPRDLKFINGQANVAGWTGTSTNSGTGNFGACCNEMDIWEANSISAAYTPHPCDPAGIYKCTGDECGSPSRYSGVCDPDGCDYNSYRMGVKNFYGPGDTVDTSSKFTIVTQFITNDGTSSGTLSEIRRLYVQNGKVIANSFTNIPGIASTYNSLSDAFCDAQKSAFGDTSSFSAHGGMKVMGKALGTGMVLVLSVWDDYAAQMLWLDSSYPVDGDPSTPGIARGTCPTDSGKPEDVESSAANAQVIYSNIKVGDIGSTYSGTPGTGTTNPGGGVTTPTGPTTTPRMTTPVTGGGTVPHYGQCGGTGYSGPTSCASPYTCKYSNAWYSQCL